MGAAVSVDLRQRAVQAVLNGEGSCRKIAARFVINHTSLARWVRQYKDTNTVKPKARTYHSLQRAIGDALAKVTPSDARGWFARCGYKSVST
jgi:transposase-like protein